MAKEKNVIDDTAITLAAAKEWHSRTEPAYRTIDDLLNYLQKNHYALPFSGANPLLEKQRQELNIKFLARYLQLENLTFKLTPLVVDAILNPMGIYEQEEEGYWLFLQHYHEHPVLEEKIMKSIPGPLRLRVRPVILADGNLTAWLFDPWEMKVYTFSINDGQEDTNAAEDEAGAKSVGTFSILQEYTDEGHPFSPRYVK